MIWREIFGGLICILFGLWLSTVIRSWQPQRGAVYELPIIKDEKGLKVPRGVYRVTTYSGKAYLMIELLKAGPGEDGR